MARPLITEAEIDSFAARLKELVRQAERDRALANSIRAAMGKVDGQSVSSSSSTTKTKPATNGARHKPKKNGALDGKVIELVKAAKGGLGSSEIAEKLKVSKERVKTIAQRLKTNGNFRVVGARRQAKYQFVS